MLNSLLLTRSGLSFRSGLLNKFKLLILSGVLVAAMPLQAAELRVEITAFKNRPTNDLVVELIGTGTTAAVAGTFEIDQVDKEFVPLLTIAPLGSRLTFDNQDNLKHHVYSVSRGNQFDLQLYSGMSPETVELTTPGIVKLGCNIHDWMLAYIYVSQSKQIQVTNNDGVVSFDDLPAGDYELRVWSPRLRNTNKPVVATISLSDGESLNHQMKIKLRKRIRKPARSEGPLDYNGDA